MDTNPNSETKTEPVMDIKPAQPQASVPPTESTGALFTEVATAPAVTAGSDEPLPSVTEPEQPTPLIATTSSVAAANNHKAPIGVIVVAVLVAVALAVLAVLTYMKNDQKEATSTPSPVTSQQAQESVSAEDVDSTNKDIDDSLNQANDASDFDSNSISDTSLGL